MIIIKIQFLVKLTDCFMIWKCLTVIATRSQISLLRNACQPLLDRVYSPIVGAVCDEMRSKEKHSNHYSHNATKLFKNLRKISIFEQKTAKLLMLIVNPKPLQMLLKPLLNVCMTCPLNYSVMRSETGLRCRRATPQSVSSSPGFPLGFPWVSPGFPLGSPLSISPLLKSF